MKRMLFFALSVTLLTLFSCSRQPEEVNTRFNDWLYAIEYDDYDFDLCKEVFDVFNPSSPACSEVRKGNFVGRNLDWNINRQASAIIKINASEGRYASLGMIGSFPYFTKETASVREHTPETDAIYGVLPFCTTDGINEKGLYIGINVTPTGETSRDPSLWKSGKWGLGAARTNPAGEMSCCVTYLIRVVLDRAASVREALELIDSINWWEPDGFPEEGHSQSFHWMIADSVSNAVVEFIDNKLEYLYCEGPATAEPSYSTIMTNFNNLLMSEGIVQNQAAGMERFDLLKEAYPSTEQSVEGMKDLMSKVWYSNAFLKDLDAEDFWCTEFVSDRFHSRDIYHTGANVNNARFREVLSASKAKFEDRANWHLDNTTLWYTTHTSIYDIKARKLSVLVHEGLDGQTEWVEADFNSSFAKP